MKVLRLSVLEPYLSGYVALRFVPEGSDEEWRGIVNGAGIEAMLRECTPIETSVIVHLVIPRGSFVRVRSAVIITDHGDTHSVVPITGSLTHNLDLAFVEPHYTSEYGTLIVGRRKVELSNDPKILEETRNILEKYRP